MIDASVLVSGLLTAHPWHTLARPHVAAASRGRIPGTVLAESWAVLRRAPYNLPVAVARGLLAVWLDPGRIVASSATAIAAALNDAVRIGAGAGVHDLVIARTCAEAGLGLVTLDRRQAAVAQGIEGLDVTLLA